MSCEINEIEEGEKEETEVHVVSQSLTIEDDQVEDVGRRPHQEQRRHHATCKCFVHSSKGLDTNYIIITVNPREAL